MAGNLGQVKHSSNHYPSDKACLSIRRCWPFLPSKIPCSLPIFGHDTSSCVGMIYNEETVNGITEGGKILSRPTWIPNLKSARIAHIGNPFGKQTSWDLPSPILLIYISLVLPKINPICSRHLLWVFWACRSKVMGEGSRNDHDQSIGDEVSFPPFFVLQISQAKMDLNKMIFPLSFLLFPQLATLYIRYVPMYVWYFKGCPNIHI